MGTKIQYLKHSHSSYPYCHVTLILIELLSYFWLWLTDDTKCVLLTLKNKRKQKPYTKIQVKYLSQPSTRFYFCDASPVSFKNEDDITDVCYSRFFSSSSSVFVLILQILFPHFLFLIISTWEKQNFWAF